ncbi:sulfotransferase family protein [Arenicella xantha]|nr:sulfotransferase [Arenicella xantha]
MPNFLIVGAVKAGTTSLYHYLSQHPDIFLPNQKEPHHFAPTKWCGYPAMALDDYETLFEKTDTYTARGEASTGYLYYPESPNLIHQALPDCKIVVILRDPTVRAYSGYMHEVREGLEQHSFEQALAQEQQATRFVRGGEFSFNYLKQGLVCDNIQRYIELFGTHQVHVCWFDDLVNKPHTLMQALFDFLNVDEHFQGEWDYRYNPSGQPKFKALHTLIDGEGTVANWLRARFSGNRKSHRQASLWHRVRDWNLASGERPTLDPSTERLLRSYFQSEVRNLEALLNRDLSEWLN